MAVFELKFLRSGGKAEKVFRLIWFTVSLEDLLPKEVEVSAEGQELIVHGRLCDKDA